jgi:hypothetical protein
VQNFVGIFFGVEAVQEFFLKGFTYLFSLSTDREKWQQCSPQATILARNFCIEQSYESLV